MNNPIHPLFILLFTALIACNSASNQRNDQQDKSATTNNKENKAPDVAVPEFSADSAYRFIEKQVSFGPRVPNTEAHDKCGAWLVKKLKRYADAVQTQQTKVKTYKNEQLLIQNIIAAFNPASKQRILLCAHWDTRPFADQDTARQDEPILGANDGGSGVGVLLELARQLHQNNPNIGVDIILFDAEDYGPPASRKRRTPSSKTWCLGSQYWAKNLHRSNYNPLYGILLDMVGAEKALFTMEGNSRKFAAGVVRKVWNTAAKLGHDKYFKFEKTKAILDDHYYINQVANIPCINIVQYDYSTKTNFGPFWHTHRDNMEIIDQNTLKAVGQTVLTVVFEEGAASSI